MLKNKELKTDARYLNATNIYLLSFKSGGDTFHYC